MKYLNKLFALDDRQQSNQQPASANFTLNLYSVIFVSELPTNTNTTATATATATIRTRDEPTTLSRSLNTTINRRGQHNHPFQTKLTTCNRDKAAEPEKSWRSRSKLAEGGQKQIEGGSFGRRLEDINKKEKEEEEAVAFEFINTNNRGTGGSSTSSSLGGYLLTATIGKTIASTSAIASDSQDSQQDWPALSSIDYSQRTEEEADEDDWILLDKSAAIEQQCKQQQQHHHNQYRDITRRRQISKQVQLQQMALDKTDIELVKASWVPVRRDPVASGLLLFKGLFTKFPQYLKFFPQFSDLDLESMQDNKRLLKHAVKVIETVTFVVDSIGDEAKIAQLNDALTNLVKGHLKRKIGLTEFRNLGIVLIDFICEFNHRRGSVTVKSADLECQLNKSSASDSSNHSNYDSETMRINTNSLVAAWTKLYGSILDLVKHEEELAKA